MAEARCSNCRFRGNTGSQFYDCRRHAPVAMQEPQRRGGVTEPHWPMVESHHWCGDHEVERAAPAPVQPTNWAVFCVQCKKRWTVPYEHSGATICDDCAKK